MLKILDIDICGIQFCLTIEANVWAWLIIATIIGLAIWRLA